MTSFLSRALAALLGSTIYFGLAVLAWGSPAAFFSHAPFLALAIATAFMALAAVLSSGNLSPGAREDRANRWVLAAFGAIGLSIGYVPAYTDRIGSWTVDGEPVRWLGVLLFAVGGALRIWPVFVLGNRFSGLVALQPGHVLVTDGIYGVIRHPSYLGLMINSLGWVLTFRSGIGILLTALLLIPLLARIRSEEALLRAQFGAEYETYIARTSRLVPGVY